MQPARGLHRLFAAVGRIAGILKNLLAVHINPQLHFPRRFPLADQPQLAVPQTGNHKISAFAGPGHRPSVQSQFNRPLLNVPELHNTALIPVLALIIQWNSTLPPHRQIPLLRQFQRGQLPLYLIPSVQNSHGLPLPFHRYPDILRRRRGLGIRGVSPGGDRMIRILRPQSPIRVGHQFICQLIAGDIVQPDGISVLHPISHGDRITLPGKRRLIGINTPAAPELLKGADLIHKLKFRSRAFQKQIVETSRILCRHLPDCRSACIHA